MSESLESMRERLAAYDRAASDQALNGAIAGAIQASGVAIKPEAAQQVATLLRPDVQAVSHNGQTHLTGPGLKPLADHVRERLASPEFNHFRAEPAPAQPQFSRPTAPQVMGAAHQIAAELRAMGQIPVQGAASFAQQPIPAAPQPTDARLDMSKPFGIRGR